MATNLMQLRRLVRSRLGIPVDDDFMTDNVLDDHINLALQLIDSEAHWPWADAMTTETITASSPFIVTAPDWSATRAVFYQERELSLVAPADLMRYDVTTADLPNVWCPIGNDIAIRPVPNIDTELTHLWYRQCAWLREDSDSPTIPAEYTGAIVAKAAELLAQRESAGGDAARHSAEYKSWVERMRKDMRRSTPGVHVRVRPGSWV